MYKHERQVPEDTTSENPGEWEEILDALSAINVTLMRLYDAQMSMLQLNNPEFAAFVAEKHDNGEVLGSPPIVSDNPFKTFLDSQ